jgi:hypothetical protein
MILTERVFVASKNEPTSVVDIAVALWFRYQHRSAVLYHAALETS